MFQGATLRRCVKQVCAALVFALLAANVIIGQASAEPIWSLRVRVIDGDTIKVDSEGPSVSLVGFAAPKVERAQCDAERDLGGKATRRLRELVRAGPLDFSYVARACPQSIKPTSSCGDNRRCGTLTAGGKDVGTVLIAEGMAVSSVCLGTRCPKVQQSWCRGR